LKYILTIEMKEERVGTLRRLSFYSDFKKFSVIA